MIEVDYLVIITVAGIGAGALHYIVKTCYTTKCSKCSFGWGCIDIDRDISEETREFRHAGYRNSSVDATNIIPSSLAPHNTV